MKINSRVWFYLFGFIAIFNGCKAGDHHQIVQISIPKCGTHLLKKCIQLLTGRDSIHNVPWYKRPSKNAYDYFHYFYTVKSIEDFEYLTHLPADKFWRLHLMYDENQAHLLIKNSCKTVFMYRDPRDQIISFAFYFMKRRNIVLDINEMITDMITTGSIAVSPVTNLNIYELYQRYLPWMNHPGILSLRFEDLVGDQGGGSNEAQIKAVTDLAHHLELHLSEQVIETVASSLFGKELSFTFRKGQIGDWKNYFTDEHKTLFKKVAGQLLIDLGYESDMNW